MNKSSDEMPSGIMPEAPSSISGEMPGSPGSNVTTEGAGGVTGDMPLGSMNSTVQTGTSTGMPGERMMESSAIADAGLTVSEMPKGEMGGAPGIGLGQMFAAQLMKGAAAADAGLTESEMPSGGMLGESSSAAVEGSPPAVLELTGEWHLTLSIGSIKQRS